MREYIPQILSLLEIAVTTEEPNLCNSDQSYSNYSFFTRFLIQLPPWAALKYYPVYLRFFNKLFKRGSNLGCPLEETQVLSGIIDNTGRLLSKCEKKMIEKLATGDDKEAHVVATSYRNHLKDLFSIIQLQANATPDAFNGKPHFRGSVIVSNPWMTIVERAFDFKPTVEFLASVKELVKPFLERRGDARNDHNGPWVSSWTVNYVAYLDKFLKALFPLWNTTCEDRTWLPQTEAEIASAAKMRDDLFGMLFDSFSSEPFRQGDLFLGVFPFITLPQRIKLFELFSMSHLESYANDSKLKDFFQYIPTNVMQNQF